MRWREKHGVELHETPVGFKYIGELIMQDKIAIGGEESAGLSIRHHVPEKDGVLAGLLCCEAVARRGKSLGEQLKTVCNQVGSYYPKRENFRLTPEVKEKFTEKLRVRSAGVLRAQGEPGGTHRWIEAGVRRWFVGVLPLVGNGTGGTCLQRGAQRARPGEVECGSEAVDFRVKAMG